MSGLVLIQTVWHFDTVPERIIWKKKWKSRKAWKITKYAKSYACLQQLHSKQNEKKHVTGVHLLSARKARRLKGIYVVRYKSLGIATILVLLVHVYRNCMVCQMGQFFWELDQTPKFRYFFIRKYEFDQEIRQSHTWLQEEETHTPQSIFRSRDRHHFLFLDNIEKVKKKFK